MAKTITDDSDNCQLRNEILRFCDQISKAARSSERPYNLKMAEGIRGGQTADRFAAADMLVELLITQLMAKVAEKSVSNPPAVRVLCAFGAVLDHTCFLYPNENDSPNDLKDLQKWVASHSRDWSDPDNQHSSDVRNVLEHPEDILRLLYYNFDGNLKGGKSRVISKRLRDALLVGGFPAKRLSLGGAPAVISNTLSQLGVVSPFYSMYHAPDIAKVEFHNDTLWLDVNNEDVNGTVAAHVSGQEGHPVRHGFAIAYGEGNYREDFYPKAVLKNERQLLTIKYPLKLDVVRPWDVWTFDGTLQDDERDNLESHEWPNLSLFVKWRIVDRTLVVESLGDECIRKLGQKYNYTILSAPQLSELRSQEDAETPKTSRLRKQLQALHDAGTIIHLELSGEAKATDLIPFAEYLGGIVDSIGVNDDELPSYARLVPHYSELDKDESAGKIESRFAQALALARMLHVSRLYVHGNDIDLILRRNPEPDSLKYDAEGDLFAKVAVLVATVVRNPRNPKLQDSKGRLNTPTKFSADTMRVMREFLDGTLSKTQLEHEFPWKLTPVTTDDGYDCAVIPCIWLKDQLAHFSATGAGDITSGVSVVYSDFHLTRSKRNYEGDGT